MESNKFSIQSALKTMNLSSVVMKTITEDIDIWTTFGKKDSTLLRAKLIKMFDANKLDPESRFMVFFFFAVIKNRNRVLAHFESLPDTIKAAPPVAKAKDFIVNYIVQYTSQETTKRFAAVHLPTTMPGLDLMATALYSDWSDYSLENNIITKQTFSQINLNSELQNKNKDAQRMFWDHIVKTSNNEARVNKTVTVELKFHEEYYSTAAKDKYLLIDLKFMEIEPKDKNTGYTMDEVKKWFNDLKKAQEMEKGK